MSRSNSSAGTAGKEAQLTIGEYTSGASSTDAQHDAGTHADASNSAAGTARTTGSASTVNHAGVEPGSDAGEAGVERTVFDVIPAPETHKDAPGELTVSDSLRMQVRRSFQDDVYANLPYPNRIWRKSETGMDTKTFMNITDGGAIAERSSEHNGDNVLSYRTKPEVFTWLADISPDPGTDTYNTRGWSFEELGTWDVGVNAGLLEHKANVLNYTPTPISGVWSLSDVALTETQVALLIDSNVVEPISVGSAPSRAPVESKSGAAGVGGGREDRGSRVKLWEARRATAVESNDHVLTGTYQTRAGGIERLTRHLNCRPVDGVSRNGGDAGIDL